MAAGAVAVAMFATSMPAMASNGLGLGHGIGRGLNLGLGLSLHAGAKADKGDRKEDKHAGDARADLHADAGLLADLSALKALTKEVRDDFKSIRKDDRFNAAASTTAEIAARKQCLKTAKDARVDAVAHARTERDSGLKSAVETYLAALTSARNAYHASVGVSGSATSTSAIDIQLVARLKYRTAVSDAQKAFHAAKASVMAGYRADLAAARAVEKTADSACKP